MNAALIGYGYWGKNIARVLAQSADFNLHTVCDSRPAALKTVEKLYPSARRISDHKEIGDDVGLVAIITPADSHHPLAKQFLERGKNVLLTKPFTTTLKEAEELLNIAEKKNLTVFVDHTFVFHPAVRKLKELLPKIGTPYFVTSQRLNLGLYQPDVNVIYDLMPHDLSIISYLFDEPIQKAQTSAFRSAGLPQEDLAHTSFELKNGAKCLVTASWLSPSKVRTFQIVGSKGMLVYDDTSHQEKIKFFDHGISIAELSDKPESAAAYTTRISYRYGDLHSPAVPNTEALGFEMSELARAIADKSVRAEYNRLNWNVMQALDLILNARKN